MALRSAALSGRKELLAWLNNLCNSTYPSVESLRDGAAYCTVVEAAISRIAQNCAATHSPEAPVASSRAEQAKVYLSKVNWSATAFVCEGGDASLDPIAVRAACAHNAQLLQDMLHNCVPVEHRYAAEASRLAAGKLQDHVLLLRWLYAFMSKVLANYSRKALEKKSEVVAGAVEGVKLNRTALLRSGQVNGVAARAGRAPSQAREQDLSQSLETRTPHADAVKATGSVTPPRTPSASPQVPASQRREKSRSPANASSDRQTSQEHTHQADGGHTCATPRTTVTEHALQNTAEAVPGEALRTKTIHLHYTRGTIAVPERFRDTLVALRNEVEDVEAVVLYVQEQHNFYMTRLADGADAYTPSDAVQGMDSEATYRLDPSETLSLEELGRLLEERDALAQQYAAIDSIVTRALRDARVKGTPISPFLRDVTDLLHPA